ncbi:hypothetical protein QNK01_11580 (plasmid) [Desemzia incerta]|nr:hypothetical protein [Desemzia incerta]WHZ33210.1 hypothetical protein QNK01_11580 [Desemzia incerta]
MNYEFDFNGVIIESIGTSRTEAFAKACATYEWLLKIQDTKFAIK